MATSFLLLSSIVNSNYNCTHYLSVSFPHGLGVGPGIQKVLVGALCSLQAHRGVCDLVSFSAPCLECTNHRPCRARAASPVYRKQWIGT